MCNARLCLGLSFVASAATFCNDIKISKFRPFFVFSDGTERGISRIVNIIIGPSFRLKRKLLKTLVAGAITFHDT